MKHFFIMVFLVLLALAYTSCGSAPAKKTCPKMQSAPTYDDSGVRHNVRKALDDADAQLPVRSR